MVSPGQHPEGLSVRFVNKETPHEDEREVYNSGWDMMRKELKQDGTIYGPFFSRASEVEGFNGATVCAFPMHTGESLYYVPHDEREMMRRIAAALRFCEGIDTEVLERTSWHEFL